MNLKRQLGFWDTFCIASGAMISSGLFVLPGQAFKEAGPAAVLAYALAALMMLPALLSQTELATAMPKSGGSYFFIERSMGALPGVLAGLANWLSLALKSAFAMVGIGAFAQLIWPDAKLTPDQWEWCIKGVAIFFCLVFMVLNLLSVKVTGRLQIFMVFGLLGMLIAFVFSGVGHVEQHPNFDQFMARGKGNIIATAALVFVSFGGLTKVASIAEEIHHPGRNIPRAMFAAYIVVSLAYVLAVFVTIGTVPQAELASGDQVNLTPLSTAASKFLGNGGMVILSVAAILAFVTTGNSGILAASRSPMAMSRDGLLPPFFQRISRRFATPHLSIVITSAFMILMIALLSISNLVKVASTMMLILFLLVNVAVLIMRGSRIQNYRPLYRSPLFPWVQLLGVGIYGSLIPILTAKLHSPLPLITLGAFVLAGVLWYFIYVRPRITRESALVYMVRNVVAKEIRRGSLEVELREIAFQRDQVVHDRFDRMIQECSILDLPEEIQADEMFTRAAGILAPRLKTEPGILLEKFRTREATSSTVIQPGLAIPHIVIEGASIFDILPVRCKKGIIFSPEKAPVDTAFILVGSPDERNYHLRVLMAIAQIVQEPDFHQKWMAAPEAEHLRDIVLLSGRKRDTDA